MDQYILIKLITNAYYKMIQTLRKRSIYNLHLYFNPPRWSLLKKRTTHFSKKEYIYHYFGHFIVHIQEKISNLRDVYPAAPIVLAKVCIIALLTIPMIIHVGKVWSQQWKEFFQYQDESWTFGQQHPCNV